jgi:hypothetical protein
MKIRVLVWCLIFACVYAEGHELSGVWYCGSPLRMQNKRFYEFSWGFEEWVPNFDPCIGIDMETESPLIHVSGYGGYYLRNVIKTDATTYKLSMSGGEFEAEYVIHLLSNDTFWIEPFKSLYNVFPTGEDKVYHNISRPPVKGEKPANPASAEKRNDPSDDFPKEAAGVRLASGEKWFTGQDVDDEVIAKSNIVVEMSIFGRYIAHLNGFEDGNVRVAWNDQKMILYIEVLMPTVKTYSGLTLGSKRTDVLDTLGIPHFESKHTLRYDNTWDGTWGILFQFENDIAVKIVLFAYD